MILIKRSPYNGRALLHPQTSNPRRPVIFINYRVSDTSEIVGHIERDLTREFGEAVVFRDKSKLEGGDDWPDELKRQVENCLVMLVIIGPRWKDAKYTDEIRDGDLRLRDPKDWVRKEITVALDLGKIVIPVLLDGG